MLVLHIEALNELTSFVVHSTLERVFVALDTSVVTDHRTMRVILDFTGKPKDHNKAILEQPRLCLFDRKSLVFHLLSPCLPEQTVMGN